MYSITEGIIGFIERVSVPLRGYGFEIGLYLEVHYDIEEFPSPCGDMVLK